MIGHAKHKSSVGAIPAPRLSRSSKHLCSEIVSLIGGLLKCRLYVLCDFWADPASADELAADEAGWNAARETPCPYVELRLVQAFWRGRENCSDWADAQW